MRRGSDFKFTLYGVLFAAIGCAVATAEDVPVNPNDGGSGGTGGANGAGDGGALSVGGTPGLGGTPSGGTPSGGTPSGGTPSGGTPSGGTPSGGTPNLAGSGGTAGASGTAGQGGVSGMGGGGRGGTSPFGGAAGMGGAGSGGRGGAGAGGAGAGGRGGTGGAGAGGRGGTGGASAGSATGGSAGTGTVTCPSPRDPPMGMMNSGDFGTTGAVCYRVPNIPQNWGCSNTLGRSITVNGRVMKTTADEGTDQGGMQGDGVCGWSMRPLPPKMDGVYYFEFSAGMYTYARFYWF